MKTNAWSSRLRRVALVGALAFATAFAPLVVASTPAQAAPVTGFNPSNIISDSLFYNGNALAAGEVQSFLNQQVPRCTIGDPGRTAGMAWGNTTIANACLRGYSMNTVSKAANSYCKAYTGRSNESAAEIIAKVGQACGISQKVLLVMLDKEQSLVSDTWPTARQIDVAMGYMCPDSGPGWSANCDPAYYGFQNQVYWAAWQLKHYQANPSYFTYKPYQNNYIQYNPNPSCGGSTVYIENAATAALYIYTPYQPNAAALAAGWGSGDGCSSYGNRNFYLMYTGWFGSAQGFNVSGDIATYWNAQGAENSVYGYPTSNSSLRSTRFPGGAVVQSFSGGVITTELNTRTTFGVPFGAVYNHWNSVMGGVFGVLGAPTSASTNYAVNGGGLLRWFQGGLMVAATAQGTVASIPYGEVYDLYNGSLGGIFGDLGYPVSNLANYSGGVLQGFQQGIVTRANGTSAFVAVSGSFFQHYNTVAGGIYGKLGFPVGKATTSQNGTRSQEFKNGYLLQAAGGEIVEITGAMSDAYRNAERSGASLGALVGAKLTYDADGGAEALPFENGIIVIENRTKKTTAVSGAIYAHYSSVLGGLTGAYGYPITNPTTYAASGGGTLQWTRNGILFESKTNQSVSGMLTSSPIYARYNAAEGGIYGWLGYPISDEVLTPEGVRVQQFQHGTITVDANGVVTALPASSAQLYADLGGSSGVLGKQTEASRQYTPNGGAILSFFSKGLIIQQRASGVAASLNYNSAIYAHYNSNLGGIFGVLGYPAAEEYTDVYGARAQVFQNGVLRSGAGQPVRLFEKGIFDRYVTADSLAQSLGEPVADRAIYQANSGGVLQFFTGGLITTESLTGKTAILPYGPIYEYYNTVGGGIYGQLGYPVSDPVASEGTTTQAFQNGTLVYSNGVVTQQR